MRLVLEAEKRARLEMSGDGFEIASAGAPTSSYQLLASSLSRVATAERVADLCPIHATLKRAAEVARIMVSLPGEG